MATQQQINDAVQSAANLALVNLQEIRELIESYSNCGPDDKLTWTDHASLLHIAARLRDILG